MKRFISAMLLLAILVSLLGCGDSDSEPAGITYVNDQPVYTVSMTSTEQESYFTTTAKVGSVAVSWYGESGIKNISWYAVEGGGWIACVGNCVRYVPAGFTGELSTAFATLRNDSSAMTVEEAKEYIPQIAG